MPLAAAVFVIEQRLLCELYIRLDGQISPAADMETVPEILALSLSSVLIAPVFEELIFRAFVLMEYKTARGKAPAPVSVSLLFGVLHLHSPYSALSAAINGMIFGAALLLSKNIALPCPSHGL